VHDPFTVLPHAFIMQATSTLTDELLEAASLNAATASDRTDAKDEKQRFSSL
jgi:hypothetical protein